VDPAISPVFNDPTAITAVNAIREAQIIFRSESLKRNISSDTHLASNHIMPIFHDLLSMLNHERSSLQEGFRLAAMSFAHELYGMYFGRIPPPLFLHKLHRLLASPGLDWSAQDPVLFWILAVALTSRMATPEQKICFVGRFETLIIANRITDFEILMSTLSQIAWDHDGLRARTDELHLSFDEVVNSMTAGD
jgi:hypothetical protein